MHLYGTGRWVVNSKGQLHLQHTRQPRLIDVLRDARWSAPRELQQWVPPRRGAELVESLWRDGRGGGCAIAGEEPQGRVCAEEAHSSRAGHIGLRGARYSRLWCVARSCVARQCAKERLL